MRPDAQDRACVRLQALLRARKGNGATHQAEDTTQVPPEDQEGEGAPPGIRLGLLCCNCLPLRLLQLQELGVLRLLNRMLRKLWICFKPSTCRPDRGTQCPEGTQPTTDHSINSIMDGGYQSGAQPQTHPEYNRGFCSEVCPAHCLAHPTRLPMQIQKSMASPCHVLNFKLFRCLTLGIELHSPLIPQENLSLLARVIQGSGKVFRAQKGGT